MIREFRAAASLLAFTNAFSVAVFGIVPGTNVGYPAAIIGIVGLFFAAAGLRGTLDLPRPVQHRRPQFSLVGALLAIFGLQLVFGIELIINARHPGSLTFIAYVLLASLLVGTGLAWRWSASGTLGSSPQSAFSWGAPRTRAHWAAGTPKGWMSHSRTDRASSSSLRQWAVLG